MSKTLKLSGNMKVIDIKPEPKYTEVEPLSVDEGMAVINVYSNDGEVQNVLGPFANFQDAEEWIAENKEEFLDAFDMYAEAFVLMPPAVALSDLREMQSMDSGNVE